MACMGFTNFYLVYENAVVRYLFVKRIWLLLSLIGVNYPNPLGTFKQKNEQLATLTEICCVWAARSLGGQFNLRVIGTGYI